MTFIGIMAHYAALWLLVAAARTTTDAGFWGLMTATMFCEATSRSIDRWERR